MSMPFVKGFEQESEAKYVAKEAANIYENAKRDIQAARKAACERLNDFGSLKIAVYSQEVLRFISAVEKIDSFELSKSDYLKASILSNADLSTELNKLSKYIKETAGGAVGGGILGGALAVVTVKNVSTLTFLSGTALPAGCISAAGTIAILGGVFALSTLIVMGLVHDKVSDIKLNDAYNNMAFAEKSKAEAETLVMLCKKLTERVNMYISDLIKVSSIIKKEIELIENIIQSYGCDFRKYNKKCKQILACACKSMETIISIMYAPILAEDGSILGSENSIV